MVSDSTRETTDALLRVSERKLRVDNTAEETIEEDRMNSLNSLQWLHSGQSIDDVFKLLSLDKGVENLLTNPNVDAFVNFISRYSHQNPEKSTNLIKTFTTAYGDNVVAHMLQVAKRNPSMADRATTLQAQQMRVWRREDLTPDDVFKLLKLDHATSNPLSNLNLDAWTAYLNMFNYLNPGRETTMINTFTRAYGDEQLAVMLEAAKRVPGTEGIAKNLQAAQFNRWMMDDLDAYGVYIKIFKVDPTTKSIPTKYYAILQQYNNFVTLYSKVK
ncbi:uncharacterized protein IUM83_13060 [Phytophthora cinnamomi]|uniref:uncharacterized protein n=1 Tax=Phytophthora cinnamomi TaxID=4785 RepID=UPI00355A9E3E|nr:hypothetical protein IUM83_13060 [Phytophthora cinnamomi]